MAPLYAGIVAISACIFAAILEGLCAGTSVKEYFATLRFPKFSFPLKVWYAIGGFYYLVFGFVIYRLLVLDTAVSSKSQRLYSSRE